MFPQRGCPLFNGGVYAGEHLGEVWGGPGKVALCQQRHGEGHGTRSNDRLGFPGQGGQIVDLSCPQDVRGNQFHLFEQSCLRLIVDMPHPPNQPGACASAIFRRRTKHGRHGPTRLNVSLARRTIDEKAPHEVPNRSQDDTSPHQYEVRMACKKWLNNPCDLCGRAHSDHTGRCWRISRMTTGIPGKRIFHAAKIFRTRADRNGHRFRTHHGGPHFRGAAVFLPDPLVAVPCPAPNLIRTQGLTALSGGDKSAAPQSVPPEIGAT